MLEDRNKTRWIGKREWNTSYILYFWCTLPLKKEGNVRLYTVFFLSVYFLKCQRKTVYPQSRTLIFFYLCSIPPHHNLLLKQLILIRYWIMVLAGRIIRTWYTLLVVSYPLSCSTHTAKVRILPIDHWLTLRTIDKKGGVWISVIPRIQTEQTHANSFVKWAVCMSMPKVRGNKWSADLLR